MTREGQNRALSKVCRRKEVGLYGCCGPLCQRYALEAEDRLVVDSGIVSGLKMVVGAPFHAKRPFDVITASIECLIALGMPSCVWMFQ